MCAYYASESKIRFKRKVKIQSKSYDIFCYLKKNKKQIALTKNNDFIPAFTKKIFRRVSHLY